MTATLVRATDIGWFGIVRLGTVQAAIGAMVMLATSLLNRVMVVEYAIAAAVPAALVAWHYGVQLSRPLWGHSSDRSAARSPWIIGGMGLLAMGALVTVDATIMMEGGGALPKRHCGHRLHADRPWRRHVGHCATGPAGIARGG